MQMARFWKGLKSAVDCFVISFLWEPAAGAALMNVIQGDSRWGNWVDLQMSFVALGYLLQLEFSFSSFFSSVSGIDCVGHVRKYLLIFKWLRTIRTKRSKCQVKNGIVMIFINIILLVLCNYLTGNYWFQIEIYSFHFQVSNINPSSLTRKIPVS